MDSVIEIVHQLKVDRDTWQAVAQKYKAAFESQTARLREFQDVCFATQAELENERAQYRRLRMSMDSLPNNHGLLFDNNDLATVDQAFGSAILLSPSRIDSTWRLDPSGESINPIFKRVEQLASHLNYGTAFVELDRLLRGPLSPKARVEGLLLKGHILQATGPDSLFDALAACSEALELCHRVSELQLLLPKIQYQRGLYYYRLRMLGQARDAFESVGEDDSLFGRANEYRQSCENGLEVLHSDPRSAFDESRSVTGDLLAELDDGSSIGKLRRTSAHFKHRAAQKVKRMSLPHRWLSSATESSSTTDEI